MSELLKHTLPGSLCAQPLSIENYEKHYMDLKPVIHSLGYLTVLNEFLAYKRFTAGEFRDTFKVSNFPNIPKNKYELQCCLEEEAS